MFVVSQRQVPTAQTVHKKWRFTWRSLSTQRSTCRDMCRRSGSPSKFTSLGLLWVCSGTNTDYIDIARRRRRTPVVLGPPDPGHLPGILGGEERQLMPKNQTLQKAVKWHTSSILRSNGGRSSCDTTAGAYCREGTVT